MSGRPWAEVLQEFMDKVTQQDAAQAAEIDALVKAHRLDEAKRWERLLERNVEAANDTASEWKERAEKAEASVARLQHWRDRAEKAEAWAEKAEAEVAGLRAIRFDDANRAEKAEIRVLATEAEKRAEKAERDLDNWQYHARSADAEAVRVARIADEWQERAEKAEAEVDELKRQLDLLRPTKVIIDRDGEWHDGCFWVHQREQIDHPAPSGWWVCHEHFVAPDCTGSRRVGVAQTPDEAFALGRANAARWPHPQDVPESAVWSVVQHRSALASEAEKRAEKAEAERARVVAESEAARLQRELDEIQRQLDLVRPTNPPPQPGTGDVWQEIIDSLSINHPMREACIKRRALGLARYGHPVQYGNGRKEDLEEELLDAAAYAWQRSLNGLSGFLINAALDPATWWTLRAEHSADLNAKAGLLERWKVLLAEAHAALVDLLTHGDDAPAASYQRAAKVADAIAGGDR